MANNKLDIYLTRNSGAKQGFRLRTLEDGSKSYTRARVPDQTSAFETDGIRGGYVGVEMEWLTASWHHGAGFLEFADSSRFAESIGVDPREYGKLQLAELPVACTGTMTSNADRYYCYWAGSLYCSAGTKLWKLSGTTWSLVGTASQNITGLAGLGSYLVTGQASGNMYTWDDSTFTQHGVPRKKIFVERDVVWGSDGTNLYSTTTPQTDDSWSTAIAVGESDAAITDIKLFNTYLFIGKEDGLYQVYPDTTIRKVWDATHMPSSENCVHMVNWRNNLIFSAVGDSLLLLTTEDLVIDISPSVWGDYDVGTCNGIAASPDYIIALFGTDLWAGWLEATGTETVARWYKITDEPTCNGIVWHMDKLYYGTTTATNYIPFKMKPDPTNSGRTTGWLTTSKFDGGFPDREKVWYKFSWNIPSCPASTSIKFEYSSDGGAWTTITTVSASAGISSTTITPFTAQQVQIRATFTGTGATASPTLRWIKLDGYVVPKTDIKFELELLCEDFLGTRGEVLEAFVYSVATDDLPPTLTDLLGNSYLVRIEPGYPQTLIRGKSQDHLQSVVRLVCWEIRDS